MSAKPASVECSRSAAAVPAPPDALRLLAHLHNAAGVVCRGASKQEGEVGMQRPGNKQAHEKERKQITGELVASSNAPAMGPNMSIVRMKAAVLSIPIVATAVPNSPSALPSARPAAGRRGAGGAGERVLPQLLPSRGEAGQKVVCRMGWPDRSVLSTSTACPARPPDVFPSQKALRRAMLMTTTGSAVDSSPTPMPAKGQDRPHFATKERVHAS